MSETPANWYPDTTNPGKLRYWDGEQWTDNFAPDPAFVAPVLPAKKSRRGLFIGLGSGALLLVVTILIVVLVVPRLVGQPHYSPAALANVAAPEFGAGIAPSDDSAPGKDLGKSEPSNEADPVECTALFSDTPETPDRVGTYTVYSFGSGTGTDDGRFLTASGRAFDTPDDASDFLAELSSTIDACSGGYSIRYPDSEDSWTADSVEREVVAIPAMEVVGWTENGSDGTDVFHGTVVRKGNLVVVTSCTAPAATCDTYWSTIETQIKGLKQD